MAKEVRIKLTAEQKSKIKSATGKVVNEIRVGSLGSNLAVSSPRTISARATRAADVSARATRAADVSARATRAADVSARATRAADVSARATRNSDS